MDKQSSSTALALCSRDSVLHRWECQNGVYSFCLSLESLHLCNIPPKIRIALVLNELTPFATRVNWKLAASRPRRRSFLQFRRSTFFPNEHRTHSTRGEPIPQIQELWISIPPKELIPLLHRKANELQFQFLRNMNQTTSTRNQPVSEGEWWKHQMLKFIGTFQRS